MASVCGVACGACVVRGGRWGLVAGLWGAIWAVAAGVLALGGLGCNRDKPNTDIIIGSVQRLQGPNSNFGTQSQAGIELAAAQINAAGGIHGRRVVVKVGDNKGIADESKKRFEELVSQGAVAVIGEVASSATLNMAPTAKSLRVPHLTPASTADELTGEEYSWTFRTCFKDTMQGGAIARFIVEGLNARRIAIITQQGEAYSQGLTENVLSSFARLQPTGEVVAKESYVGTDTDYSAILAKIKAANPDVVVATGYYEAVSRMVPRAREMGMNMPFVGGDGWSSPDLLKVGGSQMNNSFYTDHFILDESNPRAKKFIEDFTSHHKSRMSPDSMAALGYDAMKVMAAAITKALENDPKGTPDPEKIRQALATIRDFDGLTGKMTMEPDRSMRKAITVIEISEGQLKYRASYEP